MKIGITGADGLLGWHSRCRLHVEADVEVAVAGRKTFENEDALNEFVAGCDAIFHFAGMNRGEEDEVERVNVMLARDMVNALGRVGSPAHLVFSSSTHIDHDTAYGRSKRRAAEIFEEWSVQSGGRFTNLVLPHIFGEGGRPFYNSVVSTFCHQIANGETPRIDRDGNLELLHTQEVAEIALSAVRNKHAGELRPAGRRMTVSEMLQRVEELDALYRSELVPTFEDEFQLRLFNTYRSYLFPDHYPRMLKLNSDNRGDLFEAVKSQGGGQTFMSTTVPGATRGEHFHLRKVERFLVVKGSAVIRLRRMFDDKVIEYQVSGDQPAFVDMPTLFTHNITNTGHEELLTLFWVNEIFDPQSPDTFHIPVSSDGGRG